MNDQHITPSIMPKRLHDGVIRLTEEQLRVERECVDVAALLERKDAKQARYEERQKALGRAHITGTTKQVIMVEALKAEHKEKRVRVVRKKRQQRALRSKKK